MTPLDKDRYGRAYDAAHGQRDAGDRYAEAGRVIGSLSWLMAMHGKFVLRVGGSFSMLLSHEDIHMHADGITIDDGGAGIEIPYAGMSSWKATRGYEGPGAAFILRGENGKEKHGFIAPIERIDDVGYRIAVHAALAVAHSQAEHVKARVHDIAGLVAQADRATFGRPIPLTHVPDEFDAIMIDDVIIRICDIAHSVEDITEDGGRHYQFVMKDGGYHRVSIGAAAM